jgi:hypothetical protein
MNLFNFGREQLQKGMLNNMLEQVGIDDVGSFVQQFRNEAQHEAAAQHHNDGSDDEDTSVRHASGQQANLFSMGSSMLNQVFILIRFSSKALALYRSDLVYRWWWWWWPQWWQQ